MLRESTVPEQDLAGATRRAARVAADAESASQGTRLFIGLGALVLVIGVAIMLSLRPATITRSDTTLAIRAAGFSATIPLAAIDSVRLTPTLSGLGSKQNGFQLGSVYAGRFAMRPYGSVRLFVNTSRPPYITVFARTGVVILNGESGAETEQLFGALARSSGNR
jgi:hypothetical protein